MGVYQAVHKDYRCTDAYFFFSNSLLDTSNVSIFEMSTLVRDLHLLCDGLHSTARMSTSDHDSSSCSLVAEEAAQAIQGFMAQELERTRYQLKKHLSSHI